VVGILKKFGPADNTRKHLHAGRGNRNSAIFCLTPSGLIPIESAYTCKGTVGRQKEQDMGIKNLSEDVVLVDLPSDKAKRAEVLKAVNDIVSNKSDRDIIMDFSGVEIINSWNISNLLILQGLLEASGHKLVLCNVGTVTRCIFVVAGLTDVFTFADNRAAALKAISKAGLPANTPSQ
jgi:anti-anti-sigma regulatory factor